MQTSPEDAPDARIDHLVRTVLAARPGAADRVVDAALRSGLPGTRGARGWVRGVSLRGVLATGAAVVLASAALSAPFWWAPEPQAPRPPRGALFNEGPVTIIAIPGDPITIFGPGGASSPVPAGTTSIELLGEPR